MTGIRLYDTMRRAKVDFEPADPKRVTMYVCGPTVYNRAHIGNARPAVVFDVLARLLRHKYDADKAPGEPSRVVYARNITDIDDKIMAAALAEGVDPAVITKRYTDFYHADMGALGVLRPDLEPRATDHVEPRVHDDGSVTGMIPMIADLIAKGAAYAAEGHVLFDVAAPGDYGRLSRRPLDEMIAGARVEIAPYKRNPADFVLWKPSTPEQPGWPSPWGRGRPGWHIECSAMIAAHLGETIDIHGGGLDLIFPHHENELAQSSCAHDGAPLAKVWMHNGFLSMGDTKMSKSLGNVVGVEELLAAGWSGDVIRLALLSAHYRQPLVWSEELLVQSKATHERWWSILNRAGLEEAPPSSGVLASLADDLNTPNVLAELSALANTSNAPSLRGSLRLLGIEGAVFSRPASGFIPRHGSPGMITVEDIAESTTSQSIVATANVTLGGVTMNSSAVVEELDQFAERKILARAAARARKDFAESDRIRDELAATGIILEDGPAGTTWRRA